MASRDNPDQRSYLFLDESGQPGRASPQDRHGNYLGLVGCIVDHPDYVGVVEPAFRALKVAHFPEQDPDTLVLHREDLLRKRGRFKCLKHDALRAPFDRDLLNVFRGVPYTVIAIVIDKGAYASRGQLYQGPYELALALMLERFVGLLRVRRRVGNVVVESRGKPEDRRLAETYGVIYRRGTQFHAAEEFQHYLRSRKPTFRSKTKAVAGLELSDLLAHTAKCDVLVDRGLAERRPGTFTDEVMTILAARYNRRIRNDQVDGYGKVFFTWPRTGA